MWIGGSLATGWPCFSCPVSKQVPSPVMRCTYHCYSKLQAALGPQVRDRYSSTWVPFQLASLSPLWGQKQNKNHDSDFLSDSPAMVRDLH